MDENNGGTGSLISFLKTAVAEEGAQAFSHLVLYTSFGVVRGRTGIAFAQHLANQDNGEPAHAHSSEMLELLDVSVEHYSNHLPTASFDRLYLRLSDVQGFALDLLQGQS